MTPDYLEWLRAACWCVLVAGRLGERLRRADRSKRWPYDPAEPLDYTAELVFYRARERLAAARTRLERTRRPPMRIALVSCSKSKLALPAAAGQLYTSPIFELAREYAQLHAERWYVLSAKHGVVDPSTVLEPYDLELSSLLPEDRRAWAYRVAEDLRQLVRPGDELVLLAGAEYAAGTKRLEGVKVEEPLAHLQIGERLRWLRSSLDAYRAGLWSRIQGAATDGADVELSTAECRLLLEERAQKAAP